MKKKKYNFFTNLFILFKQIDYFYLRQVTKSKDHLFSSHFNPNMHLSFCHRMNANQNHTCKINKMISMYKKLRLNGQPII